MKLQIKEVTKKYPYGTVALENVSTTMQSHQPLLVFWDQTAQEKVHS